MTFDLRLRVRAADGALVRVLGLAGRRGWDVVAATVRPGADGRTHEVELTLHGRGAGDVLARQMAKLYDVTHVEHSGRGRTTGGCPPGVDGPIANAGGHGGPLGR